MVCLLRTTPVLDGLSAGLCGYSRFDRDYVMFLEDLFIYVVKDLFEIPPLHQNLWLCLELGFGHSAKMSWSPLHYFNDAELMRSAPLSPLQERGWGVREGKKI
jgi:hypothetical protein